MKMILSMKSPFNSSWLIASAVVGFSIVSAMLVAQENATPKAAPTATQDSKPDSPDAPVAVQTGMKNYWVFLKTGKPSTEFEREEMERMQAAHLENFGRLFKLGKLSAAGPLADPVRKLRGIVCVSATNAAEIPEYFAEDPFIEHGILEIEAHEIVDQQGAFSPEFSETEMEEYQIVLLHSTLRGAATVTPAVEKSTHDYLASILLPEKMRMALRFGPNDNNLAGILILKKQEPEMAETLINKIPLISNGQWKHELLPLYMSQGILDDTPK